MRNLFTRFFLAVIFALPGMLMAQSPTGNANDTANFPYWIDMMQDQSVNFFEVQKAFNIYWEGRTIDKGAGWKPFKRWESFMETRVSATGERPAPDQAWNAWQSYTPYNDTYFLTETTTGNWSELGPTLLPANGTGQPNGLGRLNNVTFHPTDSNQIWGGAPQGGLWKTSDGGQTWSSNTDNLPTLGVSSMIIDYNTPTTMYIGTGDRDGGDAPGLGVMKSVNGGTTWTLFNSGMGTKTAGMMVMHPTNPQIILAATNDGIFKTTNGALSWVQTANNTDNYKDIEYQPGNPNIVYATAQGDFYRSNNGGDSWSLITSGLPTNSQRMVIGTSADNPNYVYLLSSVSSVYQGTYRSTDGGQTFTTRSTTPNILDYSYTGSGSSGQGWYDLCIAVDPNDAEVVYTGGVNIFKSIDGGQTWLISAHWVGNSTTPSIHADQHALEYSPLNGKLYAGNDGGMFLTGDDGQSWTDISSGLAIAQVYRLGQSRTVKDLVINGYQDNGTGIYDNGSWRTEIGGDGMECIVDYSDANYLYGALYYGNIRRSTNNGISFGTVANNGTNGITESGGWITPYILHATNPNTMFVGYKNVWRSDNIKSNNVDFIPISNSLSGSNNQNVRDLKQSPANVDRLFMSRNDNKLYRTDNANDSTVNWVDLTGSLPNNARVVDIETHAYNQNILWIIQSGNIYRSSNAGGSWTLLTGTLPNVTKNCLTFDPYSNDGVYVGTDIGVFYRDATMSDWITFYNGLPANAEITEVEIYPEPNAISTGSKLRASTYGRGLWESDVYNPSNVAPIANFLANDTLSDICTLDTVKLFDMTAYEPTSWQWIITPSTVQYVNGTDSLDQSPEVVFQGAGYYDIKLVVSNTYGSDSITKTSYFHLEGGVTLPFFENFESFATCGTLGCGSSCAMTNGWFNDLNGVNDSIDWSSDFGGTPSGGTGPSTDFNPGTSSGVYLYTEASFCFNRLALLESPCLSLDGTNSPKLKFANHMNGGSMGDLHIDVYSNGAWVNDVMPAISGTQGNQWNEDSTLLTTYANQAIKVRFRGMTGPAFTSDIAIDDIGVVSAPVAGFSVDDVTPCPGQAVLFTDASTQNPMTWNWAFTPATVTYLNGTNANSQHPEVSFNVVGVYNVSLNVVNAYGTHTIIEANYINVSLPDAGFTSSAINDEVCDGDSVTFTATNTAGASYEFQLDGSSVQLGGAGSYTTNTLVDGQSMTLTVIDSNGCVANGLTITTVVFPLPVPVLASSDADDIICAGDTVVFSEVTGGIHFDFHLNGASTQNGPSNMYETDALQSGDSVHVIMTDSNGCIGASSAIATEVNPIPVTPVISLVGTNSLQSSVTSSLYRWYLNDSLLPFSVQTIPFSGFGDYSVEVIDNGCLSERSELYTISNVGLPGFGTSLDIKVYPNPTSGNFTIQASNVTQSGVEWVLTDALGRTVQSGKLANEGQSQVQVQLENGEAGVYILEVKSGDERVMKRLVRYE